MHKRYSLAILLLGAFLFCAWNLYGGLKNRRTWLRGFSRIDRRDSPWNYWVAIAGWTIFTAGFLAGFIGELIGVSLVHTK